MQQFLTPVLAVNSGHCNHCNFCRNACEISNSEGSLV